MQYRSSPFFHRQTYHAESEIRNTHIIINTPNTVNSLHKIVDFGLQVHVSSVDLLLNVQNILAVPYCPALLYVTYHVRLH